MAKGDSRMAENTVRKHLTRLKDLTSPRSKNFTVWKEFTDITVTPDTSSLRNPNR